MDQPARDDRKHSDETRWASFTPDEARELLELKARYEAGSFAEDCPIHSGAGIENPNAPRAYRCPRCGKPHDPRFGCSLIAD